VDVPLADVILNTVGLIVDVVEVALEEQRVAREGEPAVSRQGPGGLARATPSVVASMLCPSRMPPVSVPRRDREWPATVARTAASMTTRSNTADGAVRPGRKPRGVESQSGAQPDVGTADRSINPQPVISVQPAAVEHVEAARRGEHRGVLAAQASARPRRCRTTSVEHVWQPVRWDVDPVGVLLGAILGEARHARVDARANTRASAVSTSAGEYTP
jgi:hypothetical protein